MNFFRGLMAALALCLALIALPSPAQARALPQPCLLGAQTKVDAGIVLRERSRFACRVDQRAYPGPVTYGLFRDLGIDAAGSDRPLFFRHSPHRFADAAVWVRYKDGSLLRLAEMDDGGRSRPANWMRSYLIPPRAAPVDDILVRFTGVQHQRGIAPNATVMKRSEAAAQDNRILTAFAVCGGLLLTLIVYNLLLFAVLRYRFVLAYSATALAAMSAVVVWSGAISLLVPITIGTQISLILLCFSLYAAAVVWFLFDYIGRQGSDPRLRGLLLLSVAGLVGSSLVRLIDPAWAWRAVDAIYYGSLALCMGSLLACAGVAAWRGNRSARVYLLIWVLPICGAALRLAWGLRWTDSGGILAELSALFLMAFECLMTALAVGWKIGQVKTERDEAHGRENALRALAEVDPLSGLLNRRAFLERACEGDRKMGLVLFDIDHFKTINDRFGHDIGDQVITAFAALLGERLPAGGIAGRMGGEEFAVLLPGERPEDFAREILAAAERLAWTPDASVMTVSAGVATGTIRNEYEWRRAYIAADAALLEAKRGGRNRVIRAKKALAA